VTFEVSLWRCGPQSSVRLGGGARLVGGQAGLTARSPHGPRRGSSVPGEGTIAAGPPNHRDPRLSQVDETLMRADPASDFPRLLAACGADAQTKHPPSRIGNSEGGFRPLAAPGASRRIPNLPVGALDWPDRRDGVHASSLGVAFGVQCYPIQCRWRAIHPHPENPSCSARRTKWVTAARPE
jgi:hypothetical protein